MEKKKILFLMPSLFIGGAERSLLNLLEEFDYTKYDVSLFLYRREGELIPFLPERVTLLPELPEYGTFDVPIASLLKSRRWPFGIARLLGKLRRKLTEGWNREHYGVWASMQFLSRSLQPLLPRIPGSYDAAISFLGIPDVLLNKVDARVKLAWNHTDYTILGPYKPYDRKLYSELDALVSVSDPCTQQFLSVYPEFSDRAVTMQNLISRSMLLKQAAEPISDMPREEGETLLLSVGRFSEAKNFDNVPDLCRRLREQGIRAKWYLIGYGGGETLIRQRIREAGMEDYVIILGKRVNPYPYMAACDLYVQPSRYEGKCVAVIEAQCLGKPVVITNYATSSSQLRDGIDGIVVPMDNEACAAGIAALIRDPHRQKQLVENTLITDYSNRSELEKLAEWMEKT